MQTGKLQIMKAMKLYRINIKNLEDPLENPGLLEMVGVERRKKYFVIIEQMTGKEVSVQALSSEQFLMKTDFRKTI